MDTGNYTISRAPMFQKLGDAPLQLGSMITEEMENSLGYLNNKPGEGLAVMDGLEKNDIILLATDGLWDNLAAKSIIDICNETKDEENHGSSFCKAMMKQIMNNWKKFDDVTMIAVKI